MENIKKDFNWSRLFVFFSMSMCGFLRLLTRSIMMIPAMLIVSLAIAFYFAPKQLLSGVITTWNSAAIDEKITLIRLLLKSAFLLSFAACLILRNNI